MWCGWRVREPAVESVFDQGSEDIGEETVMRMSREMPLLPVGRAVGDEGSVGRAI